mmetsp:Transcript_34247/g.100581  ORF Transcript_34247/g.100581 Transcript_34247/m.100581 type:complete len:212 (-) Transcript_34247:928-1563(-)
MRPYVGRKWRGLFGHLAMLDFSNPGCFGQKSDNHAGSVIGFALPTLLRQLLSKDVKWCERAYNRSSPREPPRQNVMRSWSTASPPEVNQGYGVTLGEEFLRIGLESDPNCMQVTLCPRNGHGEYAVRVVFGFRHVHGTMSPCLHGISARLRELCLIFSQLPSECARELPGDGKAKQGHMDGHAARWPDNLRRAEVALESQPDEEVARLCAC